MSDFRIDGLDNLIAGLNKAARNTKRYDKLRKDIGKLHLKNCAKTCGEESGQLKDSFLGVPHNGKRETILYLDGKDTIEAGTHVFYAKMVNDGHVLAYRRKGKNGKRGRKVKKGFVPGTHFMEKALNMTNEQIPEKVDQFLKDLGREAGLDVSE